LFQHYHPYEAKQYQEAVTKELENEDKVAKIAAERVKAQQ
jgi:hypothetical protein